MEELRDAFMWEDDRVVRKDGCLSLHNIEFDAGPEFVGKKIEVRYDRVNPEFIEVWDNSRKVNGGTGCVGTTKPDSLPINLHHGFGPYSSEFLLRGPASTRDSA